MRTKEKQGDGITTGDVSILRVYPNRERGTHDEDPETRAVYEKAPHGPVKIEAILQFVKQRNEVVQNMAAVLSHLRRSHADREMCIRMQPTPEAPLASGFMMQTPDDIGIKEYQNKKRMFPIYVLPIGVDPHDMFEKIKESHEKHVLEFNRNLERIRRAKSSSSGVLELPHHENRRRH